MAKIAIIGSCYAGSGVCLSDFGISVNCVATGVKN